MRIGTTDIKIEYLVVEDGFQFGTVNEIIIIMIIILTTITLINIK